MTTWILVSDASLAKLLAAELPEDAWKVVQRFEHAAARELSHELKSDVPGRTQKARGEGARSSMEPRTTPHEVEAEVFARQLAEFLDRAAAKREYDNLVLVAPPHFLGLLEKTLTKETSKRLKATAGKDLVKQSEIDLRERLHKIAFPAA